MDKSRQAKAFEDDLIALCKRYLLEFDIDAATIIYIFVKTVYEVFGDLLEDELEP